MEIHGSGLRCVSTEQNLTISGTRGAKIVVTGMARGIPCSPHFLSSAFVLDAVLDATAFFSMILVQSMDPGVLRMGLVSIIVLQCAGHFLMREEQVGSRISVGSVNCSDVTSVLSAGEGSDFILLNPNEADSLNKSLLQVT